MSAPSSTHRAARESAITFTSEFEPDAARMTRALLAVLVWNPMKQSEAVERQARQGRAP